MDDNFQRNIEPIDEKEEMLKKFLGLYKCKTLYWNGPKPIFSDNNNNNSEATTDSPESL